MKNFKVKDLDDVLEQMGLPKDGRKADKIERLQGKVYVETQGNKPEVKDYEMRMWSGVIPVFVCSKCGRQMDSEDDMMLHIVGHYPKEEREIVLNRLVKDRNNVK